MRIYSTFGFGLCLAFWVLVFFGGWGGKLEHGELADRKQNAMASYCNTTKVV